MSRFRKKDIPDRWLDYKAIGNVIEGTPFVAFKVPLHQQICENLPENERHTTREIMEALPELGMVIDLTNTKTRTRYYQPDDWKSSGIEYKWLRCEGHVTPAQEVLVQFCRTVRKFMKTNPTKLIGIHCTHGLNRTGYFVCSFMVIMLQIPPHQALRTFAEARGYDIERKNYVDSIISHVGNSYLQSMIEMNTNRSGPLVYPETPDYERERARAENGQYFYQSSSRDHHHRGGGSNNYNPPPSRYIGHPGGARQSDFGYNQRDKTFNRYGDYRSRRRRDDNQNYNN